MDTVKIIEKIKLDKKQLKLTNLELSKKSGVALGTLNKILSFKTGSIKMETLNKILKALNDDAIVIKNVSLNNFGFIKVATCSPEVEVSNVNFNLLKIKEGVEKAYGKGVNLIVFPNLSITSSTLGDIVFQDAVLTSAQNALFELVNFSKGKQIVILVGLPIKRLGKIYSACAVILNGKILGFAPKNNLTNSESRYFSKLEGDCEVTLNGVSYPFSSNLIYACNNIKNFTFSVEMGDDLFDGEPTKKSSQNGAFIIANLSSSNELVGLKEYRKSAIISKTAYNNVGYLYANAGFGESTTDLVFSGHSLIAENGNLLKESEPFNSEMLITDIDVDFLAFERSKKSASAFVNDCKYIYFDFEISKFTLDRKYSETPFILKVDNNRFELILKMQTSALQKRIKHVKPKTLVVGLSGGLDSTLALLIAVRAMKNENRDLKDILAITMPCFGTTSRTKNNATVLAESLGVSFKEINIKNAVIEHFKDIEQDINVTDVTYENSQARERTQVLMDVANKTGGIVIGTGDLSELALGWATYNGDHMSMYSVNASVPKTLIRYLVNYEAENYSKTVKQTLLDILSTPVSPELIPPKDGEISQKTEDIVGPYLLHDFYLYYFLRCGFTPKKLYFIAKNTFKNKFSDDELKKWLKNFFRRFFTQQFKRSCVPDGAKIGSVGLSPRGDLVMASDTSNAVFLEELEEI